MATPSPCFTEGRSPRRVSTPIISCRKRRGWHTPLRMALRARSTKASSNQPCASEALAKTRVEIVERQSEWQTVKLQPSQCRRDRQIGKYLERCFELAKPHFLAWPEMADNNYGHLWPMQLRISVT